MLARAGVRCAGAQTSRDGGVNEVVGGDAGPGDAGGEGNGAGRRPVGGGIPRAVDEVYDAVISGGSQSPKRPTRME